MPRPGSKYTAPLDRPGPKTGRRYAAVVSAIRAQLGSARVPRAGLRVPAQAQFTKHDFAPIGAAQARATLADLARRGEVQRIQTGRPGRHSHPSIYTAP